MELGSWGRRGGQEEQIPHLSSESDWSKSLSALNQLGSLLTPGNLRKGCKSVSQKPPTSPLILCCRLIQPPWQQNLTAQMVLNREDKVVQNFSALCPSNFLHDFRRFHYSAWTNKSLSFWGR